MYLISEQDRLSRVAGGSSIAARRLDRRPTPVWTVLIPFFNEREYLTATIDSLAAQGVPMIMILVDNGSTDGSADVARAAVSAHGIDALVITEITPGKVAALRTGLGWVRTRYVATCDADTLYPPHYLAEAERLLDRKGCVVAGAYFVDPAADQAALDAEARRILSAARMLPRQCHAGGAGQCFDVAALRAAGGFDAGIWRYVLEDHEVIHRTMAHGRMLYSQDLWCMPSPRERDRASIRWTLFERLVYSATAPWAGGWFFYRFLARRLQRRRLLSEQMRERACHAPSSGPGPDAAISPIAERAKCATSHPVC
jgi:glycosyltransferase involved in cell wall biosynthesis